MTRQASGVHAAEREGIMVVRHTMAEEASRGRGGECEWRGGEEARRSP